MKKRGLFLALAFSSNIWAAMPAGISPSIIYVPEYAGGYAGGILIGLTGNYVQPTSSHGDIDYASFNSVNVPPYNFASTTGDFNPGYTFGYGAVLGYIFQESGSDVNVIYSALYTSDNNALNTLNGVPLSEIGYDINGFFTPGTLTSATETAKYSLQQVDATFGQYIGVGTRLTLHPNVGLRYAFLERELIQNYFATTLDGFPEVLSPYQKSIYEGVGPLVGLDASYYFIRGLGASAHVDSAILIGGIRVNPDITINAPNGSNVLVPNTQALDFANTNPGRIITAVDLKLGLNYTYMFENATNYDMTLEVGYQSSEYFNAIDHMITTINVSTLPNSQINKVVSSNLNINGPYASLTFHV